MSKELKAIVVRANRLHLTTGEFIEQAGINRIRWWRAMKGKSGERAVLKLVREATEAIAIMEMKMAPCSQCGKTALEARTCEQFGCPSC